MKKLLLSCVTLFTLCYSTNAFSQEINSRGSNPTLKTESDTICYAYGVDLVRQGLNQYLIDMNIITDTLDIIDEYNDAIQDAQNESAKKILDQERIQKIDSVQKANNVNIDDFLKGIAFGINENETIFNQGISVGTQIIPMSDRFAKENLDNEEDFNMDVFLSGLVGIIKGEKTTPILETESDTISYNYGADLAQQGIYQYLRQTNIITDTLDIVEEYNYVLEEVENDHDKNAINQELRQKVDSIQKINNENIDVFLKGLYVGLDKNKYNLNQGTNIGNQLISMTKYFSKEVLDNEEDFNMDVFLLGLIGTIKNEPTLIENPSFIIEEKISQKQQSKAKEMEESLKKDSEATIAEGESFLAKNKKKKGVVVLPSGLQYKILKKGKGPKPTNGDEVTVHYTGTLLDGTVFDSSIERNSPITINIDQVIKGWTEALKLMPQGSKWMLYIPYDLAYGSNSAGDVIKPYSTLIFEVELLDVPNKK